jgi:hypothetical protein
MERSVAHLVCKFNTLESFSFSSIAGSSHDEDLRAVYEPVGNGRGHSGGIENLSPFSKGQIGGQNG